MRLVSALRHFSSSKDRILRDRSSAQKLFINWGITFLLVLIAVVSLYPLIFTLLNSFG